MTSIHTNAGAIAALQTLRSIGSSMEQIQGQVSSGLRIQAASDNAAYWSISTTMRSDNMAISAVQDALGFGAAKVDVAYAGMESVREVLAEVRAKLVVALEDGVDKEKVQSEIRQLALSTKAIADSASFNGVNWLSTDIHDLYETTPDRRSSALLSSYSRGANDSVNLSTMSVDHLYTSLFNGEEGGGILDGDPRSPKSIGGVRYQTTDEYGIARWSPTNIDAGSNPASRTFDFTGPLNFVTSSDRITFNVIVDKDNPADGISGPYDPGVSTPITINRAMVDAVLPAAGGVVSNYHQMIQVLSHALTGSGIGASYVRDYDGNIIPDKYALVYNGIPGMNGSYMEVTTPVSTVGSGGLSSFFGWGVRDNSMNLPFQKFKVFKDVEINFQFSVNGEAPSTHKIDRALVNTLLGTTDGWVNTADDMLLILQHLITRPDTIIEKTSSNTIRIASDPLVDRLSGGKTRVGFTGIDVNIEPLPETGILQIDITANPGMVRTYLESVDAMLTRVISGAATLGALQSRIDMQTEFTSKLSDAIDKGIGRLVDADMNDASTRLKALQTQEQLGIQALSIANANSETILQLFR